LRTSRLRRTASLALLVLLGGLVTSVTPALAARPTCFGKRATIVGTRRADRLVGTRRADVIVARRGNDTVRGRGGNDRICAGNGFDTVDGGDVLVAGRGSFQSLLGGRGNDRLRGDRRGLDFTNYFRAPRGVIVDLAARTATGMGSDTLVNIDAVAGSPRNDTLSGTRGTNFLFGFAGNDTINSRGNAGTLNSPAGVLRAFPRFDLIGGDGALRGAAPGNDTITGGPGLNVVLYDEARQGITADLQDRTVTGEGNDTLARVQGIIGSRFADTLEGNGAANAFEGGAGTDDINGRSGQDVLVLLDAIRPTVDLDAGTATGAYRVFTRSGVQRRPFSYTVAGMEDVWGSSTADTIGGDAEDNRLFALGGNDSLSGEDGDDLLNGGDGTDSLDGGQGDADRCLNGETNSLECESTTSSAATSGRTQSWSWRALLDYPY
jgi:Ca2+-binding RTX toxin-like protein